MADEDQDGISNNGITPNAAGAQQPPRASEPEVQILEEHVTRAAQKPTPSGTGTPPAPPTLETKPAVPPTPTPSAPGVKPTAVPPPIKGPDPIADAVGLIVPHRDIPLPTATPAPQPIPPATGKPLDQSPPPGGGPEGIVAPLVGTHAIPDDIGKILAEVKLPERRTPSGEEGNASGQKKFDTSLLSSLEHAEKTPVDPLAAGVPTATPSAEERKKPESPNSVSAVHTLKNDLQGVVRDQKISVVKAVSLEEDRRAHTKPESRENTGSAQRSRRTAGILFATLMLLSLGGAALFGVLYIMNQQQRPPQLDTTSSILFAEQSVLLSLDGQSSSDLKRTLEAGRTASQGTLGSITRIIPVIATTMPDGVVQNRAATFKEFMTAVGARPPEDLVRALRDEFFLGVHVVDKNAPILIVPVSSHDHAFAAMLAWEERLNADLAPLFTPIPVLSTDTNGLPIKRTYEDLVMRNYDVRALKDDAGAIQLYYSFPTQNILILAESPYSFPEILSRLQAGRQL